MSQKPSIHLDLDLEGPEPGGIGDIMAQLLNRGTFQDRYNLRHPLGIYNVSTSRISGRLTRATENVADYMLQNPIFDRTNGDGAHLDRICDDIESCIYAAAEHVDDIESCLLCLFPDRHACSRNKIVRDFKLDLAPIRRTMSAFALARRPYQLPSAGAA